MDEFTGWRLAPEGCEVKHRLGHSDWQPLWDGTGRHNHWVQGGKDPFMTCKPNDEYTCLGGRDCEAPACGGGDPAKARKVPIPDGEPYHVRPKDGSDEHEAYVARTVRIGDLTSPEELADPARFGRSWLETDRMVQSSGFSISGAFDAQAEGRGFMLNGAPVDAMRKFAEEMNLGTDDGSLAQLGVMVRALQIFKDRNEVHKDLWKNDGAEGIVHHIRHKSSRLTRFLTDSLFLIQQGSTPTPEFDDALDLINYVAFMIRNMEAGRWDSED